MTDLSVVVVTWNARELVAECLESLDRSSRSRGGAGASTCEVLVVDNGSRDGTVDDLRRRFPWAQVIALPENVGFAAGANAGLRKAAGRYCVLLNNDTRVPEGALERLAAYLDANPQVGVVGPQLVSPDGRLQNSVHNIPSLVTEIVPRWLRESVLPSRYPSKRQTHGEPREVEAVLGACLCARSEAIAEVGPLSEDYFFFLEETDWCLRMRNAGWKIVQLPDVRVVHLHGATSKKRDAAATRIEYHRSLYRFFRKHRGPVAWLTVVALRGLKSLLYAVLPSPGVMFSERSRERWRSRRAVAAWHLRGCPSTGGLRGRRGAGDACRS